MPICPNCGSYVSEGSPTCSCGTSMGRRSQYEEEDPEVTERKKEAAEYYRKATELEENGRYAEALSSYEKSRELGDRKFTIFKRGDIYYEMGDYEAALECYRKYGKDEGALSAAAKQAQDTFRITPIRTAEYTIPKRSLTEKQTKSRNAKERTWPGFTRISP